MIHVCASLTLRQPALNRSQARPFVALAGARPRLGCFATASGFGKPARCLSTAATEPAPVVTSLQEQPKDLLHLIRQHIKVRCWQPVAGPMLVHVHALASSGVVSLLRRSSQAYEVPVCLQGQLARSVAQDTADALAQAHGPLPVPRYMSLCLSQPTLGYYTRIRDRDDAVFGRGGDFVTSPEISQVFGEVRRASLRTS